MKIALYIEDGLEQIVLTPEGEAEANILGKLHDGSRSLEIHSGTFYDCRGGWKRWKAPLYSPYDNAETRHQDESTMIVLRPKPPEPPQQQPLELDPNAFLGNATC
jgi:hypothetical protein